ncbi:hypothetical protein A2627_02025 [Candidatus Woesebacteria bacterium RIFCSPHIGHO2_01_FULL_39_28]|uniref:Uncharacterized protein n=1 Tax=Candidatus Woesebacteria bacterium RIFCSPHIGHO2_01_FULL_39_28 TaxID=1802496 RepID=A0A1F7YMQ0_9BACT|nr:MAG: hypothetical protein A2627_02025 [Candidatus Woesebacteria bacterium RIFCSPHIGHO2_01_FULL_39_28]OGM56780.1 MAG: hypothetical protein A3A50_04220 [Candidatus Woesebacteria bacterium RIFCSPLOWO2_01_FULL_38_20]
MQLQTTSIVRDRGQLTIPDLIRSRTDWVSPGSVVTVAQVKADEIVIRPRTTQKRVDADDLWRRIRLVRSFKGKGKLISLSEFIMMDRENH